MNSGTSLEFVIRFMDHSWLRKTDDVLADYETNLLQVYLVTGNLGFISHQLMTYLYLLLIQTGKYTVWLHVILPVTPSEWKAVDLWESSGDHF